jgi:hypothetical protein
VNKCKKYQTLCNKESDEFIFNEERQRIEDLQRSIERKVRSSSTSREQIINLLNLLDENFSPKDNEKNKEDVDYIYKLILKRYGNNNGMLVEKLLRLIIYELILKRYGNNSHWRADQLAHFKKVYNAITTYTDYFLSFTNRSKDVNFNYKFLIKWLCHSYRDGKNFEKKSKKNNNLLAEAINCFLMSNKPQLSGFYYPVYEGDNRNIKGKLRAAGKTFVFIQIIQNNMFSKNFDCEKNYCFFEYCEAKRNISNDQSSDDQRILFIFAEGSWGNIIPKADICKKYDNWYDEMVKKDKIILEYTKSYKPNQLKDLEDKIKKNLLDIVSKAKEKMINKVPL